MPKYVRIIVDTILNKPSSEQNWWVIFTGKVGDDLRKFTGTIYPPLDEGEEIHCICGQPDIQHNSYPILNTRRDFLYNRKAFIHFVLRLKVPHLGKVRLNRLLEYCRTPEYAIPFGDFCDLAVGGGAR